MKYEHPTIQVECPAEGHYIIHGHNPARKLTTAGWVIPSETVHISPEVPSELLEAILEDREANALGGENPAGKHDRENEPRRRGGRPKKNATTGEEGK